MLSPFAYVLHRRMAGYQTEMLHHFQELLKIPSVRGEGIPGAPFGRKTERRWTMFCASRSNLA